MAANAAQVQNTLDFTRENEKEAEGVGIEILINLGLIQRLHRFFSDYCKDLMNLVQEPHHLF